MESHVKLKVASPVVGKNDISARGSFSASADVKCLENLRGGEVKV